MKDLADSERLRSSENLNAIQQIEYTKIPFPFLKYITFSRVEHTVKNIYMYIYI